MNCGAKIKFTGVYKELKARGISTNLFSQTNNLYSHQLFTGIQLEEARDELRQGLYRSPPFHGPFFLLHDRGITHSLQQQINYENGKIKKS